MKKTIKHTVLKWAIVLIPVIVLVNLTACGQKSPDITRKTLPQNEANKAISLQTDAYTFKKEKQFIYFKQQNGAFSVDGVALKAGKHSHQSPVILTPGLTGKYHMNFYYLLLGKKDQKGLSPLHLQHMRDGETIKRFKLGAVKQFVRRSIPLTLEEGDTISIELKKADIEVAAIGDPLFVKDRQESSKDLVFIVIADTLRTDRLGVYNPQKKCSPRIDEFSKDAAVFDQAYSTSPWTLPAHMSLFTGLYPQGHNVNFSDNKIEDDIPILFEYLQEKFVTYCFNANGYMSGLYGFSRGFDFYRESFRDHVERKAALNLFDNAKKLILEEKHSRALFVLHTYQIHTPYVPEIALAEEYYDKVAPGFRHFKFNPIEFIKNGKELYKPATAEEKQAIETVYDAGVYTFDHRFGEFIDFLKEKNLYDRSTIIFTSDHGEEFLDHGAWEHGHSLYNELIKIPLLVKFPQNKHAGAKINSIVSITDIAPTLLELYDIQEKTDALHGISLTETIEGSDRTKNRLVFSYLAPGSLRKGIPEKIALITGSLKYIKQTKMSDKDKAYFLLPPPPLKDEMYNIVDDPFEQTNIRFKNPGKEREFKKILEAVTLKRGKKGNFKELNEALRSLGYL